MTVDQFQLGLLVASALFVLLVALLLGIFIGAIVVWARTFPYGTFTWSKTGTRVALNREPE